VPDLLHNVGVNLLVIGHEGGEKGSGSIELSLADEVFQVAGRRRWWRRGNGECR
jgi:hypothetical protein